MKGAEFVWDVEASMQPGGGWLAVGRLVAIRMSKGDEPVERGPIFACWGADYATARDRLGANCAMHSQRGGYA